MLRITIHKDAKSLTFQLEGRLAGPWVEVLEECWRNNVRTEGQLALRLDLTGMTCIDAAGQACLAGMHRQGTEFIAADCMTKAIVDEITQAPK